MKISQERAITEVVDELAPRPRKRWSMLMAGTSLACAAILGVATAALEPAITKSSIAWADDDGDSGDNDGDDRDYGGDDGDDDRDDGDDDGDDGDDDYGNDDNDDDDYSDDDDYNDDVSDDDDYDDLNDDYDDVNDDDSASDDAFTPDFDDSETKVRARTFLYGLDDGYDDD